MAKQNKEATGSKGTRDNKNSSKKASKKINTAVERG